ARAGGCARGKRRRKPGGRLSTSAELVRGAGVGKTEPAKLSRLMRGELDWVVMRCLEKDRSRRYDSASNLARDVERYLKDEPVEARPPSATYRLRKLFRRNKAAVLTTAVVAAALVLGTAVSTGQAIRATRAEAAARSAEEQATQDRDRALTAERKAVAEKASAQGTLRFLLADVLAQADPYQHSGANPNLTLRAMM